MILKVWNDDGKHWRFIDRIDEPGVGIAYLGAHERQVGPITAPVAVFNSREVENPMGIMPIFVGKEAWDEAMKATEPAQRVCVKLVVGEKNGETRRYAVAIGSAYLMNDEGKTIERL